MIFPNKERGHRSNTDSKLSIHTFPVMDCCLRQHTQDLPTSHRYLSWGGRMFSLSKFFFFYLQVKGDNIKYDILIAV